MLNRRTLALQMGATAVAGLALAKPAIAQSPSTQISTFERIRRDKVIRAAFYTGAEPYYIKNAASGEISGAAINMLKDIAENLDAKIEYFETSYGNSVLDLQTNKIDLGVAMAATPRRALSVSFTSPYLVSCFGVIAKPNIELNTWDDINKPQVRIAIELGSTHETVVRRFSPNATIVGFKRQPELFLALQSNKVDCMCIAGIQGILAAKKNPGLGRFRVISDPLVELRSAIAVRSEEDVRWVNFLNTWVDYNRANTQIRSWILDSLGTVGVTKADVPREVLL